MSPWWATPAATRWSALNWPWWARVAVLAVFFVLLNWLIFAPASTFKQTYRVFAHEDKVAHGAIFQMLALLARWSSPAGTPGGGAGGRLRLGVPLGLLAYGCLAEALQPLIGGTGREFEWLDMASNVAGIVAGWLLFGVAVAGETDLFKKRSSALDHGGAVR